MPSVKELGIEIVKISAGQEVIHCPFHDDKRASAWFSPIKGLFYCAVCGVGCNIAQLAAKLGLEWEGEDYGPYQRVIPDYNLIEDSPNYGVMKFHPYINYRGITPLTSTIFGLRVLDFVSAEAIVLPHFNIYLNPSNPVGATIRYIDPAQTGTRYKKIGKSYPLWPMNRLLINGLDNLIIVEGGWSAMKMCPGEENNEAVVSTLGTSVGSDLIEMSLPFKNVIFLYDGDMAGYRACMKIRETRPTFKAFTLSKSPDDMDDFELSNLWKKVRNLYE